MWLRRVNYGVSIFQSKVNPLGRSKKYSPHQFKILRCLNVVPNSLRFFFSGSHWFRILIFVDLRVVCQGLSSIVLNVGSMFFFCTLLITGSFSTYLKTL